MVAPGRVLRRIPIALLIALSVSVAVGGALASTDGPAKTGLDDGYVDVPTPKLGDQGAYRATLQGDWDALPPGFAEAPWGTPWLALNFSWEDGGQGRDEAGAVGPVDRLRVAGRSWDHDVFADTWTLVETGGSYDHRSGEAAPFVQRRAGDEAEAPEIGGNPIPQEVQDAGLPLPQSNQGAGTFYSSDTYRQAKAHCMLGGAFQGTRVPVHGKAWSPQVWGPDVCEFGFLPTGGWYDAMPQFWDNYITDEDLVWHPLGRATLAGHEAIGFTHRDEGHWLGGRGLDIWLSEDLPYPLRVVTYPAFVQGAEEGGLRLDESKSAVFDLVSFVPGAQERMPRGAWTGGWGPWNVVPLQPWGMDESGVAHPFPASKAYRIAKEQDANTSAFLRDFPDAYTGEAHYFASGDQGLWTLWLTDGPHALKVEVLEEPREQPTVSFADPLHPVVMPGVTYTITTERHDEEDPESYQAFPDAADAPKLGPSVAQVIARWREAGGDDAPNAWAHDIRQGWTLEGRSITALFAAGASAIELTPTCLQETCIPGTEAGYAIHQDMLVTESNGTLASRKQYDSDWNGRYGLTAPVADPAQAPGSATSVGTAPFWQPTPRQAAGAGAVGILAGLLYLLWPAVKAGPSALFSRVHGPQLLEHPVRLRLSQLVHASPGIHFKELRRQSGLANGVLVHHLDKLARSGLVTVKEAGRYRCYFPPHTGAVNGIALAAVKADGAQRVLAALRSNPGLDVRALADATGLNRGTVHYHLQRLQEAGLVRQTPLMPGVQGAQWTAVAAA